MRTFPPLMKIKLLSLVAGLLLAPLATHAADFEGKVGLKMTSGKSTQTMTYSLKNGKMRIDLPNAQGVAVIVDPVKRETTTLMGEQKMYMVNALSEPTAAEVKKQETEMKLEKTGETEKILGYTAEKFIATDKENKTEMWLAEGLGMFMSASGNPMGRSQTAAGQGWEKLLAGKQLFPLRIVGHDKAGKETYRMEATSIDKQSLPDAMFVPPADYQKFDIGNMGGMGGMMKGLMPGR